MGEYFSPFEFLEVLNDDFVAEHEQITADGR